MNDTVALLISLYTGFGLFFTILTLHRSPPKTVSELLLALIAVYTWPVWIAAGLYRDAVDNTYNYAIGESEEDGSHQSASNI